MPLLLPAHTSSLFKRHATKPAWAASRSNDAAPPQQRTIVLAALLGLWLIAPAPLLAAPADASDAARTSAATAPNTKTANVQVHDAWVRWLPGTLPAAAYMVLTNNGDQALELVTASSPDYAQVMLHRTINNGSTSTMQMADKLVLPPHRAVSISPGGYHFMLSAARHAIEPGATIELELQFSNGATLTTRLPVSPPTRTQ